MKNLKLFSRLQSGNTAFLILRPITGGKIVYFIMSTSVNYNLVTSGTCLGNLGDRDLLCFDVSLSSVMPLVDKGRDMSLVYSNDILRFEDVNGRFFMQPLCVEHRSDIAMQIAEKFQDFSTKLDAKLEAEVKQEELELTLKQAHASWKDAYQVGASGWVNDSNPFGDVETKSKSEKIDAHFEKRVAKLNKQLDEARETCKILPEIDMSGLRRLADAAAKYNTTVSMCETFAVVPIVNTFLFQRMDCGIRAVQGKLLQQLLRDTKGHFYSYKDDIVFSTTEGKGTDKTVTAVFILPYLPNVAVNDTLITKGAVQERYTFDLEPILPILAPVIDKFEVMEFDMGSSVIMMSNDSGEKFQYSFDAATAETLKLRRYMRGERVAVDDMSIISIPREVQKILPMFKTDFTIHVKSRKVVLQSGKLYAVFSR